MKSDHMLLLCSYRFRQASDFWYLTGFQEPESAILLGVYLHV